MTGCFSSLIPTIDVQVSEQCISHIARYAHLATDTRVLDTGRATPVNLQTLVGNHQVIPLALQAQLC
jgi:hypothetical protein